MIDFEAITIETLANIFGVIERGYVHNETSLNELGERCHLADRGAVKFDLYGALMLTTRKLKLEIVEKETVERMAFAALNEAMPEGFRNITHFCKETPDAKAVLEVINLAIFAINPNINPRQIRKRQRI